MTGPEMERITTTDAARRLGVSPSTVRRRIAAGRLRVVLRDFTPDDSAIYAVYPSRRYLTPKVRTFIDFLVARFGPEPYWDTESGLCNAATQHKKVS